MAALDATFWRGANLSELCYEGLVLVCPSEKAVTKVGATLNFQRRRN